MLGHAGEEDADEAALLKDDGWMAEVLADEGAVAGWEGGGTGGAPRPMRPHAAAPAAPPAPLIGEQRSGPLVPVVGAPAALLPASQAAALVPLQRKAGKRKRNATEQPWLRLVHGGPAQLQALKGTSPVDNEKLQEVLTLVLRQRLQPLLLGGALERALTYATGEERSCLSKVHDWLVRPPRPESGPLTGEEQPFKRTGAFVKQGVLPLERCAFVANTETFPVVNFSGITSVVAFELHGAPFKAWVGIPIPCGTLWDMPAWQLKYLPACLIEHPAPNTLPQVLSPSSCPPKKKPGDNAAEPLRKYRKCRKYLFAFLKVDLEQLPRVIRDLLDEKDLLDTEEVSGGKLEKGTYRMLSSIVYCEFEADPASAAASTSAAPGSSPAPAAAEQPRRAAVGPVAAAVAAAAGSSMEPLSAEGVGHERAAKRPRCGSGAEQPASSAEETAAAAAAAGAAAAAAVAVMAAAGVAAAAAMKETAVAAAAAMAAAGVAGAAAMVGAGVAAAAAMAEAGVAAAVALVGRAAATAGSSELELLSCFVYSPGKEAKSPARCEQLLSGSLKGPAGDWQPLLQLSYALITKSARPLLHWLVFPPERQLYYRDEKEPPADSQVDYRLQVLHCIKRTLPRPVFLELLLQCTCHGATVLHRAAACADVRIVRSLCGEARVPGQPLLINTADRRCLFIAALSELGTYSNYLPLHEACRHGRTDNAVVVLKATARVFGIRNMPTMVYPLRNKFFVAGACGVGGDKVLADACAEAFGAGFKPAGAPTHGDTVRLLRSMECIIASASVGQ
ncbi:hypothetical protein FOA52_014666 [Chlamydomonas sp. UWO 241]|nr:hypothetical protein FOA52_014666 [Chlamydomonas sp. UWO 241]